MLGNVCDLYMHHFPFCYLTQPKVWDLKQCRKRELDMERGEGGEGCGGLGMNFKYRWPNLQEIDQALPS